MNSFVRSYHPYISPNDPCPPVKKKYYATPPQLFIGFQPRGLPQFPLHKALMRGTLWPIFSPEGGREE
ncbi:spore coat associated protein CotJA [Salimicrobium halophilum]|uniref:Spore coat protein JA n=1 Tax=Salimicrobium halophilum TaxID=86666 RepID=A0A1G8PYX7_9BACI|nr:spore coat associated protein CotJA [Salimicrobium halophilum]SDI97671.1 spore coat protein JA [Salimicrobium halophilum]